MLTLGINPGFGLPIPTTPPVQTDHDLMLALNEQIYALRKELQSLHRLMAAMKKTMKQTIASQPSLGIIAQTEAAITMPDASYHDPLFDLDMDQIGA